MKTFNFVITWLKTVSILFIIFGLTLALFNHTTIFQSLINNNINPAFFKSTIIPTDALYFQRWIYALLGATCVMLGIIFYCVVHYSLQKKEKWSYKCLLLALFSWFIIDTPISIHYKVYFNVFFNITLLIVTVIPLLLIREYYKKDSNIN